MFGEKGKVNVKTTVTLYTSFPAALNRLPPPKKKLLRGPRAIQTCRHELRHKLQGVEFADLSLLRTVRCRAAKCNDSCAMLGWRRKGGQLGPRPSLLTARCGFRCGFFFVVSRPPVSHFAVAFRGKSQLAQWEACAFLVSFYC